MKALMMIAFAYVLTGIHYVWRDYREPVWNRPSYVSNGIGALLFMVVYWFPGTVFSTYVRGPIKRHVTSWLMFAGLLTGLTSAAKYRAAV